jgi:flagellar basal body-associated protein FliL
MNREKESNPIIFVLLCFLLFLVLMSCVSVFFWLQSFRAMQLRDQAERAELSAKAEAARVQRAAEESDLPTEDAALP